MKKAIFYTLITAFWFNFIACGKNEVEPRPPAPEHKEPEPRVYTVEGAKKYYIIGNDLILGDSEIVLSIKAKAGESKIKWTIDDTNSFEAKSEQSDFDIRASLSELAPGKHVIALREEGRTSAFAQVEFILSHPYYIFVSNDWDDPDSSRSGIEDSRAVRAREKGFHDKHPHLKLTHFLGPYTFTAPLMSEGTKREIVNWLLEMKKTYGDEVGLHIHPRCNFIESVPLTCKTVPNLKAPADKPNEPYPSGFAVVLGAYTYGETRQMLVKSKTLFQNYGLPIPLSFRAGGWSAELHTLKALADEGFLVDASGANWKRLSEGKYLREWNRLHWGPISDTSQPYYPSINDILSSASPNLNILEVPNNGVLVDYIDGSEMIAVFKKNWALETALNSPKVYSIGYHPSTFTEDRKNRLDEALRHVDKYLISTGNGPAVYVTASEVRKGWPKQ